MCEPFPPGVIIFFTTFSDWYFTIWLILVHITSSVCKLIIEKFFIHIALFLTHIAFILNNLKKNHNMIYKMQTKHTFKHLVFISCKYKNIIIKLYKNANRTYYLNFDFLFNILKRVYKELNMIKKLSKHIVQILILYLFLLNVKNIYHFCYRKKRKNIKSSRWYFGHWT